MSFPTSAAPGPRAGPLLLLGGCTASGKSALALSLAERTGAVIVGADSQQLFADLRVLTARPTPGEEARVAHRLYGVLGPREQPSVGRWLALVVPLLEALGREGRPAILVGGTGLYLQALLHGLAAIPPVPASIRAALHEEAQGMASEALHARLAARDAATAARLRPSDRQRILRALEVLEATGRPLAVWQDAPRRPPIRLGAVAGVALLPPAAVTSPRIARRLEAQLAAGAQDEVRALAAREPELETLPIAKVHGCRELLAVVRGQIALAQAHARIEAQVRQYAKRQRTWFRRQLPELAVEPGCGDDADVAARLLPRLAAALGGEG